MKLSILLLGICLASSAFAQDTKYQILKKYFDSASHAASLYDFDSVEGSITQDCYVSSDFPKRNAIWRTYVSRMTITTKKYGPLFLSKAVTKILASGKQPTVDTFSEMFNYIEMEGTDTDLIADMKTENMPYYPPTQISFRKSRGYIFFTFVGEKYGYSEKINVAGYCHPKSEKSLFND